MGIAGSKMRGEEALEHLLDGARRGSFLPASMTAASLLAQSGEYVRGTKGPRTSSGSLGTKSKRRSGTRRGHRNKRHRSHVLSSKETRTTPRNPVGDFDNHGDIIQDEHRILAAESNGSSNRDCVPLARTAQLDRGLSIYEGAGGHNKDASDAEDSGTGDDQGLHSCGTRGGDDLPWGPDDDKEEDQEFYYSSECESRLDAGEGGAYSTASQDVHRGLILSRSSSSSSVFSRSSVASRMNAASWSFLSSSSSPYPAKHHSKAHSWFSVRNGGRLKQKKVDSSIRAEEGVVLSDRELVEDNTIASLRERLRTSRLDLSRERLHLEAIKKEEAQMRRQLSAKYEAEIAHLKKKVQDQETFRTKMLDQLAQYESEEMEPVGQGAGQNEGEDVSSEVEALRRSNKQLTSEMQGLRHRYQKQRTTLRQERGVLANARKALEAN